jgi:hypothetical protein
MKLPLFELELFQFNKKIIQTQRYVAQIQIVEAWTDAGTGNLLGFHLAQNENPICNDLPRAI